MNVRSTAASIGAFLPAPDRAVVDLHHLRAAIEASDEVIFMTDRQGTITFVNLRFVEVYGYQPAEVIGRVTPRILKSGQTAREELCRPLAESSQQTGGDPRFLEPHQGRTTAPHRKFSQPDSRARG